MNINSFLQSSSAATQHLTNICDNLKHINGVFPWINTKNAICVLLSVSTGMVVENKYQVISNLLLPENRDYYTELAPLLDKCRSEKKGNCLLRMQTEGGLYESENIEKFLASEEKQKEAMVEKTPSIADRTVLYEDKIINQSRFSLRENKTLNQRDIAKIDADPNSKILTVESKQVEIIAVEFASDEIYEEGVAASCTNSTFYNKQIELKNPLSIENNTVVSVVEPINCEAKEKTKIAKKCGAFPRVQIPFSEASKLYPLNYNPDKNINTLERCGLAQVEIIQD